jgi:MAPEG family protein
MEALMGGKQGLVLLQITLAVVALLVLMSIPGIGREFPAPQDDDVAARLAFAAKWLLVPALCLLAGIGTLGTLRFFSDDGIDGTRTPASHTLEINIRYNLNTLEQTVLAAFAWTGLALVLPHDQLGFIGVLAAVFAVGRVLFWSGYLIAPWARAIGFGLTFYPTVAALLWLASRAVA